MKEIADAIACLCRNISTSSYSPSCISYLSRIGLDEDAIRRHYSDPVVVLSIDQVSSPSQWISTPTEAQIIVSLLVCVLLPTLNNLMNAQWTEVIRQDTEVSWSVIVSNVKQSGLLL